MSSLRRARQDWSRWAAAQAAEKLARREAWLERRYRIWRFGMVVTGLVGFVAGVAVGSLP